MKKIIAVLIALCMIGSTAAVSFATEATDVKGEDNKTVFINGEGKYNPLYPELAKARSNTRKAPVKAADIVPGHYVSSFEEGAKYLRKQLVGRENVVNISMAYNTSDEDEFLMYIYSMIDEAMVHTGISDEGDYIQWHWTYIEPSWTYKKNSAKKTYDYNVRIDFEYYTTHAQELEMTTRVNQVVGQLNLKNSDSNYDKIKRTYDFITKNIVYDYEHVNDIEYGLQQSAYAGLINGTCVCQGYATLMYRLLLEGGVDCRVVTSYDHAWNIAKIGEKYYNFDSTWDAQADDYSYFMLCDRTFTDDYSHVREYPYNTDEFYKAYLTDAPLKTSKKASFKSSGSEYFICDCKACNGEKNTITIPMAKTPTLSTTEYSFNNKVKSPKVTVRNNYGEILTRSVSYSEGRKEVGTYSVKTTLTGDRYTGTKTVYFKINPNPSSISSLNAGKKSITVKWSKPSATYRKQMTGYEIKYSRSSKMTNSKTVKIKSTTATSKVIKNLTPKKKYYVKIRKYKVKDGKTYYSTWSKYKTAVVK